MKLNLPIFDKVSPCQNLLIAGMGGGFDIFCGLPIYFELFDKIPYIHLANLTFSNVIFSQITNLKNRIILSDTLVGITANTENLQIYFPEFYLSQYFQEKLNQKITIWCFKITGVNPLLKNYQILINHLGIDGILLIDGGVDSLILGDEKEKGTFIEDLISLAAVAQLHDISTRLIGSLGFGAERDITYPHILENIAHFTKENAFLGTCSLVKTMDVYQKYKEIVLFTQQQKGQDSSVINSSIISSVEGEYGDYHLTSKTKGSELFISPLMSIYWFFELTKLAEFNLYLDSIKETETMNDVFKCLVQKNRTINKRK